MNEKLSELTAKWIDDTLSADERTELDAFFAEDPSLQGELKAMKSLGGQLRSEFPENEDPPYPDFFNTRIMQRIGEEEKQAEAPVLTRTPWWSRVGWGWIPASGLAAVLAFFAGTKVNTPDDVTLVTGPTPDLPAVYTADVNYAADVIADDAGEVSVIVLRGLEAIGDEVDFATADAVSELNLPEGYLDSQRQQSIHF